MSPIEDINIKPEEIVKFLSPSIDSYDIYSSFSSSPFLKDESSGNQSSANQSSGN